MRSLLVAAARHRASTPPLLLRLARPSAPLSLPRPCPVLGRDPVSRAQPVNRSLMTSPPPPCFTQSRRRPCRPLSCLPLFPSLNTTSALPAASFASLADPLPLATAVVFAPAKTVFSSIYKTPAISYTNNSNSEKKNNENNNNNNNENNNNEKGGGGSWGRHAARLATAGLLLAAVAAGGQAVAKSHPKRKDKKYTVIAGPGLEEFAEKLEKLCPERFHYYPTKWKKFEDGSDHIEVGGFTPHNVVTGSNVLFLSSFHNNDVTLSQYHALIMLCESFIDSLTILLPFLPHATMERVTTEGVVATANTTAKMLSELPSVGKPTRVMLYDLHTLQNRFFFGYNAIATLHSTFPLIIEKMKDPKNEIDCVAFPDDGAHKRFGYMFAKEFPGIPQIVCGKTRDVNDPKKRTVVIKDGDCRGKHVIIVDDLVRTGGTLAECAKALQRAGAINVSAFVAHAVFPKGSFTKFLKGGKYNVFDKFWVTNSNPTVSNLLPLDDCFEVIDIIPQCVEDL